MSQTTVDPVLVQEIDWEETESSDAERSVAESSDAGSSDAEYSDTECDGRCSDDWESVSQVGSSSESRAHRSSK